MKNSVQKLMGFMVLVCFSLSPAAFGAPIAQHLNASQLYKQTYIDLMNGKEPLEVFNKFVADAKANNLSVKEVLEAAVQKNFMTQAQMNMLLDVAQKNTALMNDSVQQKLKAGTFSKEDLQNISQALQGQVQGASYYCGVHHGCYAGPLMVSVGVLLALLLIATPVFIIVG